MWAKFLSLFTEVVAWVQQVLPTAFSVGMMVYGILQKRITLLKIKVSELALLLKYKENEKRVEENNRGKSDSDIVDDLISEGRKLNGSSKPDSDNSSGS